MTITVLARTVREYDYTAGAYVDRLRPTGETYVPHSASDAAAVFLASIRLTPHQLLADPAFLRLARQAVADGKTYTADLLEWERKPVVQRAVATLRDGIARKAARPVAPSAGIDTTAAARKRIADRHATIVAFRTRLRNARPGASMAGNSTGDFRFGPVLVTVDQTCQEDWDRYSKGWHRSHGPARTYVTTLTVTRLDGLAVVSDRRALTGLRAVDRRAAEAVAETLALPRQRGQQGLRIDPHVTLTPVESPCRRTTVYRRDLAGECLGFVAVRRGQHYHDSSAAAAVDGVREKLVRDRASRIYGAAAKSTGIDVAQPIGAALRSLGFCRPGVADALDTLGLEDRRYDLPELVAAGEWDRLPAVARKYPAECATIARHLAQADRLPARVQEIVSRLA